MKLVDAISPPSSRVVVGLADTDAHTPVELYFAAFRWEPPAIDPASIPASLFLAMLDDVRDDH